MDYLIARGSDETRVRKTVLLIGMVMGLAVFGATQTTDLRWAIAWILDRARRAGVLRRRSAGLFRRSSRPKGARWHRRWDHELKCEQRDGLFFAPIVTGYIVGSTNSFTYALIVAVVILAIWDLSLLLSSWAKSSPFRSQAPAETFVSPARARARRGSPERERRGGPVP